MKIRAFICVVIFIVCTSYLAEFCINKSDSDLLIGLFIVIESILIYFLIYKPIKSLLK